MTSPSNRHKEFLCIRSTSYQPTDMGDVLNTVKNGSTVPLKFEVFAGTTELSNVSVVKSFATVAVNCTTGVEDSVEEFFTTGDTTLRYDSSGIGQFIQNWQTPKKLGCFRVTMAIQDGSTLSALFKLK